MKGKNLALPGNPRYQPKELVPFFGYDNLYKPAVKVEIATLKVLGEIGVIPKEEITLLTSEVKSKILSITTTQVDDIERNVTKHDIRALVRIIQEILPPKLRRWVHIPLTSYDVLDTARILQFKWSYEHWLDSSFYWTLFSRARLSRAWSSFLFCRL